MQKDTICFLHSLCSDAESGLCYRYNLCTQLHHSLIRLCTSSLNTSAIP